MPFNMIFRSLLDISRYSFFQNSKNVLGVTIQTAGLRHFPVTKKFDLEYPPDGKKKLPLLPKVPSYPSNLKPFKMQKRLKLMRGPELVLNKLIHKQFGVVALSGGRMRHGHFEMVRWTCNKYLPRRAVVLWRVDSPWQPVTQKTAGTRMGGGKGEIYHYVTPIKSGRVIIEVMGPIHYLQVRKALEEIAHKLPFKAMAVTQNKLDKISEEENYVKENNENPWTMKYIIQNNFGGCHRWIKPIDKYWFGKYK